MVNTVKAIKKAHPGVELVVFGETILGWYKPAGMEAYHRNTAESIPGETTRIMADLARECGIYVSFGMSELNDSRLYNAQVLLDPDGEIAAVHRKMHLKDATFHPGTIPVTITDIKGIRTGIVICYDIVSPRVMWELVKSRLDLIILSLADDRDENSFGARFNARMYDAWIVTANRYGDEAGWFWNGHVVISDPVGALRVKAQDEEQYVFHEIGFATDQSWLKRVARRTLTRMSVVFFVLRNLKIAREYI